MCRGGSTSRRTTVKGSTCSKKGSSQPCRSAETPALNARLTLIVGSPKPVISSGSKYKPVRGLKSKAPSCVRVVDFSSCSVSAADSCTSKTTDCALQSSPVLKRRSGFATESADCSAAGSPPMSSHELLLESSAGTQGGSGAETPV